MSYDLVEIYRVNTKTLLDFSSYKIKSIHPLGATALGEPWPPLKKSSFRGRFLGFGTNYFYVVGLSAPRPTPNLEDQGIPFRLGHHP
jgi:hypothetical protein